MTHCGLGEMLWHEPLNIGQATLSMGTQKNQCLGLYRNEFRKQFLYNNLISLLIHIITIQ
jgi:hypothetical protein